ncbi:MAG: curli assembly protein CsgF [Oleiphilaceae bacterium]|nr:curli assembly protein CsgF [Oleiphilaceae bacterium]
MKRFLQTASLTILLSSPLCALADLVYSPANPAFGGNNPNAAAVNLNNAQSQDSTRSADSIARRTPRTAREQFEQQLQRTILSQISRALRAEIFDQDGLLQEGTFDAGDFTIDIIEADDGGLEIITTDLITGDSTRFRIGQR